MRSLGLTLVVCGPILQGCASPQRASVETPADSEVVARYNERASRLGRVWARAVVTLEYTDEDGRRRNEQGEGHLQLAQPDRIALSVGKLGEILVYLGCDSKRYWWFDMAGDESFVALGLHENVGRPCSRELPIEAHPLDIIDLLGVTPLPAEARIVGTSPDGIVVDSPGRLGRLRLNLDPSSLMPRRIELFENGSETEASLVATLSDDQNVELRGVGGFFPRMASRIEIDHTASESSISISLYDHADGEIRGRIPDSAFDFATLTDAFGPELIAVLDKDCDRSAVRLP